MKRTRTLAYAEVALIHGETHVHEHIRQAGSQFIPFVARREQRIVVGEEGRGSKFRPYHKTDEMSSRVEGKVECLCV